MVNSVEPLHHIKIPTYPQRATALMDTAFMCISEICFHMYEDLDQFYIKATNLNGYRELLCVITTIGENKSSVTINDMRIDFVSSNMSDAKKYYVLWLLERNRDFFFEEYITKKNLHNPEVV